MVNTNEMAALIDPVLAYFLEITLLPQLAQEYKLFFVTKNSKKVGMKFFD